MNHRRLPRWALVLASGIVLGVSGEARAQLFTKDTDGDGIRDKKDRCPYTKEDFNGIEDEDGCPDDADKDGIANAADRCPMTPEDMNGYEDDDGCPDDSDGDGIPNFADRCPLRKAEGEDGCAEKEPAVQAPAPQPQPQALFPFLPASLWSSYALRASFDPMPPLRFEPILFHVGSHALTRLPDSETPSPKARCDQLIRMLLTHPELKVYLIGHASEEGSPEENVKLSQRRADAVRSYLLSFGIPASRIVGTLGKGSDEPYDQGSGPAAWRLNRRVEVYLGVGDEPLVAPSLSASVEPALKLPTRTANPTPQEPAPGAPVQAVQSTTEEGQTGEDPAKTAPPVKKAVSPVKEENPPVEQEEPSEEEE